MNSYCLQKIVRFGAVVLIVLAGFVLLAEGSKSSHSYSINSKPRTNPREIRGLRPPSLSTAIGFGKRESSFRSSDPDRHSSIAFSRQKEIPQSFSIFWFLQYLRSNPKLANKVVRQLSSDDNDDDDNVRPSATHLYKKFSDSDDSYYLNE